MGNKLTEKKESKPLTGQDILKVVAILVLMAFFFVGIVLFVSNAPPVLVGFVGVLAILYFLFKLANVLWNSWNF